MNYKTEGLNRLSVQLRLFQIEAGFAEGSVVQRLLLIHSEISEAAEALRKDKLSNISDICNAEPFKSEFEEHIKDSFEDEIADAIIRLLALCAEYDINIESHIEAKMKYNELRDFKAEGKKF